LKEAKSSTFSLAAISCVTSPPIQLGISWAGFQRLHEPQKAKSQPLRLG
jgi:hypothetical protein